MPERESDTGDTVPYIYYIFYYLVSSEKFLHEMSEGASLVSLPLRFLALGNIGIKDFFNYVAGKSYQHHKRQKHFLRFPSLG